MVYIGTDPLDGSLRYLRETAATYDEAELALTKLQRQVDENKHPKSAITVAEAIERWLEIAKLEETTRDRYEDLIRLYILPRLGAMQAGKVDPELDERLSELSPEDRARVEAAARKWTGTTGAAGK